MSVQERANGAPASLQAKARIETQGSYLGFRIWGFRVWLDVPTAWQRERERGFVELGA